tara:strand:- start:2753 stop:5035 length:2283 start_codon:yes stop_codon:yes gene_type:complete
MFNNSNRFFQIIGGVLAFVFTTLQGIDWLFKRFSIDAFYFNIVLITFLLSFISIIVYYFLKYKKSKSSRKEFSNRNRKKIIMIILIALLFFLLFFYFFKKINNNNKLLNTELPVIIQLYDEGNILEVFKKTKILAELYPNNEIIKNYYDRSRKYAKLKLNKSDVNVSIKYRGESDYNLIGKTPIDSFVVPKAWDSYKLKLEYNDNVFYFDNVFNSRTIDYHEYNFPDIIEIPNNHQVFIGREISNFRLRGKRINKVKIPPFSLSKNEVSNSEFYDFIKDGGYENPKFWDFPIKIGKNVYEFKSTVQLFTDKFGKQGPLNWSYGNFPNGLGDHPVTGISWLEAKAYAKYKKLEIPNIFQWVYAADDFNNIRDKNVTKNGNFNTGVTRSVYDTNGSINNINNIGGNVREWILNNVGDNKKLYVSAGGSYLELNYTFHANSEQDILDRSLGNGIRLAKSLVNINENKQNDYVVSERLRRNLLNEPDISDDLFLYYKSQFDYEHTPLNVSTSFIDLENKNYSVERFEMSTTYNSNENLFGFIAYSNKIKNKYDPIIVFPHAGSLQSDSTSQVSLDLINRFSYLIDEGYAIIYPIYSGLYSRARNNECAQELNQLLCARQSVIRKGQDYKRAIDYIESRSDFNFNNLSYYGASMGAIYSNIMLAIDDRVKSAFIIVGGVPSYTQPKETDYHYYTRRIKTPILHIVGKLDPVVSYNEMFLPWKEIIGTPKKDLKIIEMDDVGHFVPRDTIYKYHRNWIKKYSVLEP